MNTSIKLILLLLAGSIFADISAQEIRTRRQGLFNSNIFTTNRSAYSNQVLYEIKDSSVVVTTSTMRRQVASGNVYKTEIPASTIQSISIRRSSAIRNGGIIGGILFGVPMNVIIIIGSGEWWPVLILAAGIPAAAIGTGIGILIGSLRDIVRIDGSQEKFNLNRNHLQRYSFVNEPRGEPVANDYGHKSFIGLSFGPSFPIGDFGDNSQENSHAGFAGSGGGASLVNAGYKISPHIGISVNLFSNSYDFNEAQSENFWTTFGFMAGPYYSVFMSRRIVLDIKPRVGYFDATLSSNEAVVDFGRGFGLSLTTSLQYNFGRRWCLMAETGILTSSLKFTDARKNVSTANIGMGVA